MFLLADNPMAAACSTTLMNAIELFNACLEQGLMQKDEVEMDLL